MKKISDLQPAEYNPRKITAEQLTALKAMLREYGDLGGIVVNVTTGKLVGGHQRVKALDPAWAITKRPAKDSTGTVARGHVETPYGLFDYREVAWDARKERAANLAANKAGGAFDLRAVAGILTGLDDGKFNLDLTGFLAQERLDLLGLGRQEGEGGQDDVPEPPGKATTKPGQLVTMGAHRLLCGDATDTKAWARLMDGKKASLVHTDPPYGVSYEAKSGKFGVIQGDHARGDALAGMLVKALRAAVQHASPSAAFYVWHASSTRDDFAHALRAVGLVERQYLIWAKTGSVMGHADYRWAHEPCFYASRADHKPDFYGNRAQATVWRAAISKADGVVTTLAGGLVVRDGAGGELYLTAQAPKGKKARAVRLEAGQVLLVGSGDAGDTVWELGRDHGYQHPTQKPVELAVRAISNSSRIPQIVVDPFLGSGTTLLAAERLGRACYGMELDPRYCDVVVKRWETATRRRAERA